MEYVCEGINRAARGSLPFQRLPSSLGPVRRGWAWLGGAGLGCQALRAGLMCSPWRVISSAARLSQQREATGEPSDYARSPKDPQRRGCALLGLPKGLTLVVYTSTHSLEPPPPRLPHTHTCSTAAPGVFAFVFLAIIVCALDWRDCWEEPEKTCHHWCGPSESSRVLLS